MTNHVHFLVSPRKKDAISRVTQVVGSTYASYVNEKYERTGSLWEGRHRSCLVDSDQYLLTCHRYIELNPVRAGLVRVPGAYPWSSFRINASPATSWLAPHGAYLGLGKSAEDRTRAYLGMFDQSLADEDVDEIRATINSGMPLARESFIVDLERRHDVSFGRKRRGWPKRARIEAG